MDGLIQDILLFPTRSVSIFTQAVLKPFSHSERYR